MPRWEYLRATAVLRETYLVVRVGQGDEGELVAVVGQLLEADQQLARGDRLCLRHLHQLTVRVDGPGHPIPVVVHRSPRPDRGCTHPRVHQGCSRTRASCRVLLKG